LAIFPFLSVASNGDALAAYVDRAAKLSGLEIASSPSAIIAARFLANFKLKLQSLGKLSL